MGTITRAFANNITTSGVFKPTAFNNASFDNVTSVPEGAVESGSMVLISTTNISSGASSVEITSGIDSTYNEYVFMFNNITGGSNGYRFQCNFSTDGGSNYNVEKTSSSFISKHFENDAEAPFLSYDQARDSAANTGYEDISNDHKSNDADCGISGYMKLFNPSSTTYLKNFIVYNNTFDDQTRAAVFYKGGYANTTSAINAVIFRFELGTFDDGTLQMFGIL